MPLAQSLVLLAIVTFSVLLHEFGHVLVAKHYGVECAEIEMGILGGAAKLKADLNVENMNPLHIFNIAIAGPIVSLVLATLFHCLGQYSEVFLIASTINVILMVFNLLPIHPLDGGRMLESILYYFLPKRAYLFTLIFGVCFSVLVTVFTIAAKQPTNVLVTLFLWLMTHHYYKEKVK